MSATGIGLYAPWSLPAEPLGALGVAAGALFVVLALARKRPLLSSQRVFLTAAVASAAMLSAAYVAFILRGGPRIIDATAYALEARIFASGHATWLPPSPLGSFTGRFLVPAQGGSLAVIFPPGYPLVLASFTRLGAPLILGPALGAAITLATHALAETVLAKTTLRADVQRALARGSALFAVASACMRYHTADTMAHGLLALLVTCSMLGALRADKSDPKSGRWAALAGACAGYAITTRFTSGFAVTLVAGALLASKRELPRFALGLLAGLAPLLIYQAVAFGSPIASGQAAYYAASDGPPGCFRYGFGAGIGCLYEHGDYVKHFGGRFGALPALETTGRRFFFHLGDVLSFEPLFALVVVGAWATRETRALGALVVLHVLFQAPFYFPGTYPGGGARMYADVIPLEHVLLAVGASAFVRNSGSDGERKATRVTRLVLAAAMISFGLHNVHDHLALRAREGGRPMYASADVATLPQNALVFVDSDHGFNWGAGPERSPFVARHRGDDHDRILFEALGRPPAFRHHYDATTGGVVVTPWNVNASAAEAAIPSRWVFDADNEWPALEQRGGMALPAWEGVPCPRAGANAGERETRSSSAALRIQGAAVLRLAVPGAGDYVVTARARSGSAQAKVAIGDVSGGAVRADECVAYVVNARLTEVSTLTVDAGSGIVLLDSIELTAAK